MTAKLLARVGLSLTASLAAVALGAVFPALGFVALSKFPRLLVNDGLASRRGTRSCGRVGPARLGSTVPRSSVSASE